MSIAAITSSFVAAVRDRPAAGSPAPAEPVAEVTHAAKGGRRHELVDAMQQALGSGSVEGKSGEQAVFRFAHALMHDLRKIEGGADGGPPGGGRAWGRRSYNDLPQRLEALATAAATPITPASPAVPATPIAPTGGLTAPPAADLPVQPDPLTATSAALHLMQVPSSRLLEAYAALRQVLGDGEPAPASDASAPTPVVPTTPPDTARAALAEFLTRLSTTLSADTSASLPTGSLVNVRA